MVTAVFVVAESIGEAKAKAVAFVKEQPVEANYTLGGVMVRRGNNYRGMRWAFAKPRRRSGAAKQQARKAAAASGAVSLTPRQAQIMALVAAGQGNPEIAEALSISLSTVGMHISTAYARLGVTSREDAIARWQEQEAVPPLAAGA
ncbi:MAG TPA: helix-turn-helix transcriptional regulator [Streptosporangiaceae bacterium]|nr:helix-turn-helix transcriptional regulator [Streptosporangiaceae bacterium]